MLKEILKNALFGITISCSLVAVGLGAYAVVDCAQTTNFGIPKNTTTPDDSTQQTDSTRHIILWSANGGTGSKAGTIAEPDKTIKLIAPDFTYDGWNFVGWSTTATNFESIYHAGYTITDEFLADKDYTFTMYAVWGKSLTLNATGGKFSSNNSETLTLNYLLGDSVSGATITVPTKSGYTFKGFFAKENGQGTQYFDASGTAQFALNDLPATLTIYAYWVENSSGGSGAVTY